MNNGKHGQGGHCTKMSADTPNIPQIIRPNLSAQAQKFGIFEKKTLSLGDLSQILFGQKFSKVVIVSKGDFLSNFHYCL